HLFSRFIYLASTQHYSLSLHDALPISGPLYPVRSERRESKGERSGPRARTRAREGLGVTVHCRQHRAPISETSVCVRESSRSLRSEEHTSELQSRENLVCRHLLE